MTMGRHGHRRLATATARACTALLLAGLTGCGSDAEAEAGATPRHELPTATPTPEVTEQRWETDLTLSSAERKAVDEAYDVLIDFLIASRDVTSAGGDEPDRALQFTTGRFTDMKEKDYQRFRDSGERTEGYITYRYFYVLEVKPGDHNVNDLVEFETCIDMKEYDILDSNGESLKDPRRDPFIFVYTISRTVDGWKASDIRNAKRSCG